MGKSKNNLPYPTCDKAGCDGMTPEDMVAICFNSEEFYCTPECARSALEDGHDVPKTVELVDPQYAVDRAAFPGVPDSAVSIQTEVTDQADAIKVVDRFEHEHPHEFRPEKAH